MSEQTRPEGHPLVRFAIERRVTLWMAVAALMVLGVLSLSRLPLEFLPTFSSSSISVQAPYPSASPAEVEQLIVRPLEDVLGTINGIETLSAAAASDSASIRLTFVDGTDMDLAAVEVRDRVERARALLPDDLENVRIRRFQSTDIPIVNFQLTADWPRDELFDFTENVIVRRLERLEGVAQVSVHGLQTPTIQVDVDPDRMRAHGVSLRELTARIRADNRDVTAGAMDVGSQRLLVRTLGELRTLEELRRLPIQGPSLRLEDIAEVRYAYPRQEEFNYLNGREALTVRINKASTANLLEVVDTVKAELEAIGGEPAAAGLEWKIYHDASKDVRLGLAQLRNAGLFGGSLAVLAVFFFVRRFRTTALVAVAIPVSVVGTFVGLYFLRQTGLSDVTLNVVSLAGLMLALGMLVDNSIVVIEAIFRHRNDLGQDARTAALRGTSEVALPIVASTATTLCVFLPTLFLGGGGWMETYMRNIATTVCIVMVVSLVVALTVVPMAAVVLLARQEARPPGFVARLRRFYGRALAFTLRHRAAFVTASFLLLGGSIYLFGTIERAFTQGQQERFVRVLVDVPRQYSVDQTSALFEEIYARLDGQRGELGIADISYSYDRETGRAGGGWDASRAFDIYLADESEAPISTADATDGIRALLPTRAGVTLRVAQSRSPRSSGGLEVELMGDDLAVLERLSAQLLVELGRLPMLEDLDTSLATGDEEVHVSVVDDRAARAGLSSQDLAFSVASSLSSRPVSYFKTADRELDLVVQLAEEERETLDQLRQLPLDVGDATVPLETLATFARRPGPTSIERENHQAKVTITASTEDGRSAFQAIGLVTSTLSTFALPPGYSWSFGRWTRFQQQDQAASGFAMLFAVVLVYMLMAALFESFAQPLVILVSVPFALLGVAVVLKIAGQPLEAMTTIGVIILLGVVVNNAIVLIDHVNRLRRSGLGRDEAILQGGQDRLRPILITAVTTIVGLLPMVLPLLLPSLFGPVEGRAGTWAPIGLVIMGGLTTSTFLTLGIVPTVYSLVDDLLRAARGVVDASRRSAGA